MKKALLSASLIILFGMSFAGARDNTTYRFTTDNMSNKVEYSVGNKYEQKQNTGASDNVKTSEDRKNEIYKQIKEKKIQIYNVRKTRGSTRSKDAQIDALKKDIQNLEKELNTIK